MVFDENLAKRIRVTLKKKRNIEEKKMFGGCAFLLKGKMFCGVIKDDLVVRTGPDKFQLALGKPHSRPMDFTGKPMKGYIYVAPEGCKTAKTLSWWVDLAYDHIDSILKDE